MSEIKLSQSEYLKMLASETEAMEIEQILWGGFERKEEYEGYKKSDEYIENKTKEKEKMKSWLDKTIFHVSCSVCPGDFYQKNIVELKPPHNHDSPPICATCKESM